MERRLLLHEKLKGSKLTKMTVKEGDRLVTLNLRTDIIDERVQLGDKVLFMLEAYAEKQEQTKFKMQQKLAQSNETTQEPPRLPISPATPPQSVKRVRFDISEEDCTMKTGTDNKVTEKIEIVTEEIVTKKPPKKRIDEYFKPKEKEQKITVSSTESNELFVSTSVSPVPSSPQLPTIIIPPAPPHSNQEEEFKKKSEPTTFGCRLCRLKFSNQRALHEHVARIHGGKGGTFSLNGFDNRGNQKSSRSSGSDWESLVSDDIDDEDNFSNRTNDLNDDENDDEDDNTSNGSLHVARLKRKKFLSAGSSKTTTTQSAPHPNVAIRVAKVAYYNSKLLNAKSGGNSYSSALKSNIFASGGIRGNFFSQERLPIRSCKIKMKLATQNEQNRNGSTNEKPDENNDANDFEKILSCASIVNNNEIKRLDKNTVQTSQNIIPTIVSLKDTEIKAFFKSLLTYIPIGFPPRLDDLIKHDWSNSRVKTLRFIYANILDGKQFGVTYFKLKKDLKMQNNVDLNAFDELIKLLLDEFLVLAVGVVERVYVAHQFKQHWVIQSVKNLKGRGFTDDSEINQNEDDDYDCNVSDENLIVNEHKDLSPTPRVSTRSLAKKNNTVGDVTIGYSHSKQFKPVCLVPRPWRYIDGLLNRPVLKKMLETIVVFLKSYPYSSFSSIVEHFSPVLQPIMTLELLEMLEKLKCVNKKVLSRESECNLFSGFQNDSYIVAPNSELNGDELFFYYCTPGSIFNIKILFPN